MEPLRAFDFFEPGSIREAGELMQGFDSMTAKLFAGGLDLVPRMRRRQISLDHVVSLQKIPGLNYIETDKKGNTKIGAMTTIRGVELSSTIRQHYVSLYEAAHHIASIQVKTMGTVVGNLCVATPASDLAVSLIALGAKLRVASPDSERIIPLEEFFVTVNQTALQPGEIVVEILLPKRNSDMASAHLKLTRTSADVAKVNTSVMLTVKKDVCQEAKVVLGSVAPTPIRITEAEQMLEGKKLKEEVIEAAAKAAAKAVNPITDIRSTAEYRREMAEVLTKRTILQCVERLHTGNQGEAK